MKNTMKKLMIATLGLAVAGSVFGDPVVYDYKATVKHTYLKEATVTVSTALVPGGTHTSKAKVYLKKAKSSSLKGYLIQDVDTQTTKAASSDIQRKNRCYLVVLNRSAEKDYRYVRILPGIIDASWYSSKALTGYNRKTSVAAQGYLYLGGDMTDAAGLDGATFTGTGTEDTLYSIERVIGVGNYAQRVFISSLQSGNPLKQGIDDYFFTSCYLFGKYNQPDWNFEKDGASSVDYRWFFADAWLNGAGLGKASYSSEGCCGRTEAGYVLDSLTGNLKAGLYLCGLSGTTAPEHNYLYVFGEQFWAETWKESAALGTGARVNTADTWADGELDLGTTDVGYGTWSIKRNTNAKFAAGVSIKNTELPAGTDPNDWLDTDTKGKFDASVYPFIKAAAQKLDKNVVLFGNPIDGALINVEFHNAYLDR